MRRGTTLGTLMLLVLVVCSCGGGGDKDEISISQTRDKDGQINDEIVEELRLRENIIAEIVSTMPFRDLEYAACITDSAHSYLDASFEEMYRGMVSDDDETPTTINLREIFQQVAVNGLQRSEWEESFVGAFETCSSLLTQEEISLLLAGDEKVALATPDLQQRIQLALEDWIIENGSPASSLAVVLPDASQVLATAGFRDLRTEEPVKSEDYWRIASVTKPITSAVILRLVEQGLIDVEATVATYLGDEWATGYVLDDVDYASLITVRQVLNHTDGFREYAFDPGFYIMVNDRLDVPMEPQEVVDWAFDVGPQYVPGTEYSYNTVGHIVAGLIIEAVTEKTAHEAMRELVFDPAGVTEIYLTPGEWPPIDVPAMYVQGELASLISLLPGLAPYLEAAEVGNFLDLSAAPQEVLTSAPWTGGGVEAQMDDLARLFKALFDGTVLKEESLALMSETALDTLYGLGVQLGERVGYRTFEHGGGVPGFRSHARYFPDLDISIALSANLIPLDPDVGDLADTVAMLVIEHLKRENWDIASPEYLGQNDGLTSDPNAGLSSG